MEQIEERLVILESVDQNDLLIVMDYWKRDHDDFTSKPGKVAKIHNIDLKQLKRIIKASSYYSVAQGECLNCNIPLFVKVYSQSGYLFSKSVPIERCEICQNTFLAKLRADYLEQEERIRKSNLEKHREAIANINSIKISDFDMDILNYIVNNEISNVTKLKSHFFYIAYRIKSNFWAAIYRLRNTHLLITIQDENNSGKIGRFEYDKNLKEALQNKLDNNVAKADYNASAQLNFVMLKNEPKKTGSLAAFEGSFNTMHEIKIEAGSRLSYHAWLNSDDSLSLQITSDSLTDTIG